MRVLPAYPLPAPRWACEHREVIAEVARTATPPSAPTVDSSSVRRSVTLRLVAMLTVDAVFLLGVLVPYLQGGSGLDNDQPVTLALLGYVSVFTVPVIAYLVGIGSLNRLLRLVPGAGRRIEGTVLAAVVLGLATYVSPWGIAALRALLAD